MYDIGSGIEECNIYSNMKNFVQTTCSFIYIKTKQTTEGKKLPQCLLLMKYYCYKSLWFVKKKVQAIQIADYEKQDGLFLEIPFTCHELQRISIDKVKDYLGRIIDRQNTENILVEKALLEYVTAYDIIDGKAMVYLYLPEVIKEIEKKFHINRKKLRIIVVDTENEDILWIVNALCDYVNYFTVMTNRQEHFKEIAERIWNEQGLLIDFRKKDTQKRMKIFPEMIVFTLEDLKREGVVSYYDCMHKCRIESTILQQIIFGTGSKEAMHYFTEEENEYEMEQLRKKIMGKISIFLDTLYWNKL